jgi:hypothetical protein
MAFSRYGKIVSDDCIYAKLVRFVKNKKSFIINSLEETCSR